MASSCLVNVRGGLALVAGLLVFCCYCKEIDFKSLENNERFCSKDDDDGDICIAEEEQKYSQKSNEKKADSEKLSIELKLKELDFNNGSTNLEDLGIKATEPITEWKSVALQVVEAVKIGHVQTVEVMPGEIRQMKTLSVYPPIFEIPDFLDPLECDFIVALAERKGMKQNPKSTYNNGITFEDPDNTFKTWDYDKNGFIDPEEIVLLPGKIDLIFSEEDALKMFKDLEMDRDENGKIDLEEFKNTDLQKIKEYINERLQDMSQRRNATSEQAWLWHDEDELLRYQPELMDYFHERLEAVTKIPKEVIQESEPLQVLKYEKGSYNYCHQDSESNVGTVPCCQYGDTRKCRLCRFISISYFLNDVEEGGEMIFPYANSRFEDIMLNSGNWTGFFTFAKTTGSRNKFNVQLTFKTEGANKIIQGNGTDESGPFELIDSLVVDDIIRFRKRYTGSKSQGNLVVKYAGRVKSGATIEGRWWVPGHPRMNGNFFMYNTEYERWMDREIYKCDSSAYCPRGQLVIKPKKGTAVMWYNHKMTDDKWIGALDEKSYHGNCDVIQGDKWMATNWINVMGDGNMTMTAWKGGKNWLSVINREKNEGFVQKMCTNEAKKEDVIEQMFNKDMEEKMKPSDSRPPERHVLNAVTSLLEVLDHKDIAQVSTKVHQKLQMTCIPLVFNHEGKIRVVDGSKAD